MALFRKELERVVVVTVHGDRMIGCVMDAASPPATLNLPPAGVRRSYGSSCYVCVRRLASSEVL
eukprot:scaffold136154_cov57-Attheya_sp.AAC.1